MFGKSNESQRRRSGVGIVRLFLSLIILFVLSVGLYVAFKNFSGLDPLKLDPENTFKSLINNRNFSHILTDLLSIDPKDPINGVKNALKSDEGQSSDKPTSDSPLVFKFAVMADSHKDTESLKKALDQAKIEGAEFVVGMGDLSDVGTLEELQASKKVFESSQMNYYVAAGDHDLWDSTTNKKLDPVTNFKQVFGSPYQSFSAHEVRFIIIYNSDNYQGLDQVELSWLEGDLERVSSDSPKLLLVFAPTPLYHPSSDHVMGKVTPKLKDQAAHLLSLFGKYNVDQIFSADTHFFSKYKEPTSNIEMVTVGAVTSERNPQTSRFAMVDVFEDGSYNIREIEIH